MEAAAKGFSSKDDSFSPQSGPKSSSRTFCRFRHTTVSNRDPDCYRQTGPIVMANWATVTHAAVLSLWGGLRSTLTFICQLGMKSALWRTRSKIFCSWGLMKELSRKKEKEIKIWEFLPLWTHFAAVLVLQRVPWILSICPILSAAPRTLHRVLTILSALASDRTGESNRAFPSGKHTDGTEMRLAATQKGRFNVEAHWQEHFVKAVPNVNTLRYRGQLKRSWSIF